MYGPPNILPESKIERKHHIASPLTDIHNTISQLDFKEIPRRFRTEDYVARQTCLEWIHGRGKYRNLDTPVCILIYSVPGFRDFSFLPATLSRRGVQQYIQGCQVGQTKYRISDTMVADAASITAPAPHLRHSSAFFVNSPSYFASDAFMKSGRALSILA